MTDAGDQSERVKLRIRGRVQGVGFRYTAHNIARRHDVTGYVKNLTDGRVELVMEGPDDPEQRVGGQPDGLLCGG